MIQDRVCRTPTCGKKFKGGPRAYYCHNCRYERKRIREAEYRIRNRTGQVRSLGSTDICKRCGGKYIVIAGTQMFCEDCQLVQRLEYDARTSIVYYHKNKDKINPIRNERRRIGMASCIICKKEFDPEGTVRKTCCKEHEREYRKMWQKARYYKSRSGDALPPGAFRLSDIAKELGIIYTTLLSQYRAGKLPDPDGFNYLGAPYWLGLPVVKVKKRNINILSTDILSLDITQTAYPAEPKTRIEKDRIRKQKIRDERIRSGLCPQCGKPWEEPEATKKGREPAHCLSCQRYFKARYEQKKSPPTS